jgi:hypothetical protein
MEQRTLMSHEPKPPSFDQFSRWLAERLDQPRLKSERYETLREAAREARDEFVAAHGTAAGVHAQTEGQGPIEVLYLLAAADKSESSLPPEITTPSGFRVTLAYEEATGEDAASICVLVNCPPELIGALEGQMVCLWYGTQRFELGQFDGEGKAIGLLPAGLEITSSDFAQGRVKLEEPRA